MTTVRTTVRAEFYADIIIGAVEGGTNYWAYSSEYTHETPETTSVKLADMDEVVGLGASEDGIWHSVNLDTIAKAFGIVNKGPVEYLHETIRNRYRKAYTELDAGDLDAGDADNLVQIGIFGKIIYG